MILLLIPLMAWVSRMGGGGWPRLPLGLDQWLLAAPYLLLWPLVGWWVIPSYGFAVLGLRRGHGRGFDYGLPFKVGAKREWVERFIPSSLPIWRRKFNIMLLTGIMVPLGAACGMAGHGYLIEAGVLILSGAMKAVAYFAPKTEQAEWIRGACLGIGLWAVL